MSRLSSAAEVFASAIGSTVAFVMLSALAWGLGLGAGAGVFGGFSFVGMVLQAAFGALVLVFAWYMNPWLLFLYPILLACFAKGLYSDTLQARAACLLGIFASGCVAGFVLAHGSPWA